MRTVPITALCLLLFACKTQNENGNPSTANTTTDTIFIESETIFQDTVHIPVQSPPSPEIAVPTLFFGARNAIRLRDENSKWTPSFPEVEGGVVEAAQDSTIVYIVPNSRRVVVKIKYTHTELEQDTIISKQFDVVQIPKPDIQIQFPDGRSIDAVRGLRTSRLQSIQAVAVPDKGFQRFFPDDSRYRVAEWKVTLASGPRPKEKPLVSKTSSLNLNPLRSSARPGDRLVIEVLRVQRFNYKNEVNVVPFNFPAISVPIN
jgi:hypothetical protein